MTLRHPFVDLAAFPERPCGDGTDLWRITSAERAATPWWFSCSGDGRFDLNPHSGCGTCYLADTVVGALLETIWRDVAPTGDPMVLPPIAASEVASLRACAVGAPAGLRCADVTARGDAQLHTSFGITEAIGMCDGYQRPQEWAAAWHAADFDGVAYRLAHGTGLFGWALFGAAGERDVPAESVHVLDDDFLSLHGIGVDPTPTMAELDVIDDEAAAVAALDVARRPRL